MIDGSWCPSFEFLAFIFIYLLTTIELIGGQSMVLCTWVVIIGLINTIYGVLTNIVFTTGSLKLLFKFLLAENPFNPQPKLTTNPITTPLLTTFVLGAITVFFPMVVMTTLKDRITSIPTGWLQVSATTISNTLGEVVLTQV